MKYFILSLLCLLFISISAFAFDNGDFSHKCPGADSIGVDCHLLH
jgi:hypothetical protein